VTGPYCTWGRCREPAVAVIRGDDHRAQSIEGGTCEAHRTQVEQRARRLAGIDGTVTVTELARGPTPDTQDALF